MATTTQPTDDLAPPDWPAIELPYCAGVISISAISKKYGVSRAAIHKHAQKHGWVRATQPQILARANELVASATATGVVTVSAPATAQTPKAREEAINLGAAAVAVVLMNQRKDIERVRTVGNKLLAQLEDNLDHPELLAMLFDALSGEGRESAALMTDLARLATSLPEQVRVLKTLTETLGMAVNLERQSYGLNKEEEGGGIPTAIIKDYTGLDDPDSPGRDTDREEEEA